MNHKPSVRPRHSGQITVITGSMFAGKTEELIRLTRRALYAKRKVQVFKPAIDDRYDERKVVTHMGVSHAAVAVSGIPELAASIQPETDTICIEECQFFDNRIVPLVQRLADQGRDVILAGLDQDFRREPFGSMPALLAIADEVVKLRAICMNCGAPASHTYRTIEGKPAHYDDPVILIGATEAYEARCRACFKLLGRPKSSNR
ncbi:MAG TPA: thymidine kinase [Fimbriimonadaceae bacterium]|nr:thymidine kinase [Fimbriimonadaceae bacterium]